MHKRFQVVKAQEHTFLFKYDKDAPELLHIYVRHLTEISDALIVFFKHTTNTWNVQHQRFESFTETHGLYWFWKDEGKKIVVVITCFNL